MLLSATPKSVQSVTLAPVHPRVGGDHACSPTSASQSVFTRSRSVLPGLKCTTWPAGLATGAPVRRFLPSRGRWYRNEKLPKPRISIRPPPTKCAVTCASIDLTAAEDVGARSDARRQFGVLHGVIGRFVRRITVRRVSPQEDAMVWFHNTLFPRENNGRGSGWPPLDRETVSVA